MSVDEPNIASPILVTGATGRHGGTGRAVARSLISKGFRVRALVRQRHHRAEAVAAEGAEVVVGDYANYGSLLDALDGVRSAYFCYPVGAGIAEAAGLFATAGKERGLRRIVDRSRLEANVGMGGCVSPQPRWKARNANVLAGFFHAPIPIWSQATRNSRSFHVGACRAQRRCRH
jgi:NAD(P)H dehydrogenase (quinone)